MNSRVCKYTCTTWGIQERHKHWVFFNERTGEKDATRSSRNGAPESPMLQSKFAGDTVGSTSLQRHPEELATSRADRRV